MNVPSIDLTIQHRSLRNEIYAAIEFPLQNHIHQVVRKNKIMTQWKNMPRINREKYDPKQHEPVAG